MPSGPAHSPTPWQLVLSVTSSPWMVSQMDGAQSLTTSGQHLAGVFLPEHWFLGPPPMPSPRPSPPGSRASVTISAATPTSLRPQVQTLSATDIPLDVLMILVPSKDPTREAPVPGCKTECGEDPKRSVHDLSQPSVKVPSAKPELERVEPRQKASRSPGGPYEQEGTADA